MNPQAAAGSIIEGKYKLERELGAGGMGAVWLATQLMVDRKVAVKLLHPAFLDQQELQQRFEVEAKAIGKLNHPNCITLFDFGFSEDLGAFYTVIEYIDGVSLDKKLGRKMTVNYVTNIIRQIAMALDHAHYHGILHRDLKPENVMLATMTDGSEIVKVLDFGIARIVKGQFDEPSDESQRITKAGEVFGTPAYMSPEQARSIRRLSPAADLYSLGVIYYELLSGELPFFANSAFDLLMLHVTKPVPPLRRSDVPDECKRIIYRLLEKDPAKRYQSGTELVKAIDEMDMSGIYMLEAEPTRIDHTIPGIGGTAATTMEKTAPNLRAQNLPIEGSMAASAESTTGKIHTLDYADTDPSVDVPRRPLETFTSFAHKSPEGRRRIVVGLAAVVAVMLLLGIAAALIANSADESDPLETTGAIVNENKTTFDRVKEEEVAARVEPEESVEDKIDFEPDEVEEKVEPKEEKATLDLPVKRTKKKNPTRKKKKVSKVKVGEPDEKVKPKEKKKPDPVDKIPLVDKKYL